MVIDAAAWGLIPAAGEAYERREDIKTLLEKIQERFFGKKRSIAITGMPGVGKTVLFDHIRDTAFSRGYELPGESESVEKAKIKAQGLRIERLTVA